jgi:hypothetical protein
MANATCTLDSRQAVMVLVINQGNVYDGLDSSQASGQGMKFSLLQKYANICEEYGVD